MQASPPHTQEAQKRETPVYQKPEVKDLGPWQTLTLIYSVPMGPGGRSTSPGSQTF
ncbi:hypothetical protein ACINK0_15530 [Deinococcus sp. VB343]|uniref:hypothetical protein n=1 Tax=Deinococcus sp. VB343 TaxID=3385567 RepID=UPI0039C94D8A